MPVGGWGSNLYFWHFSGSKLLFPPISILALSDQLSAFFMSSTTLSVDMRHELEHATRQHQLKKKSLLFRLRKETWTFFELKILASS
jgi:hypothetical protein